MLKKLGYGYESGKICEDCGDDASPKTPVKVNATNAVSTGSRNKKRKLNEQADAIISHVACKTEVNAEERDDHVGDQA